MTLLADAGDQLVEATGIGCLDSRQVGGCASDGVAASHLREGLQDVGDPLVLPRIDGVEEDESRNACADGFQVEGGVVAADDSLGFEPLDALLGG